MHLEFAPMEGITSYLYRRIHHEMFPGADVYYSPFIAPDAKGNFKLAHLKGLLPDNNTDLPLIPQILANNSVAFLEVAGQLTQLGYTEVNLNAGCPSGTVVSKHKGAGMLADTDSLRSFLDAVFESRPCDISIKTRMGLNDTSEFHKILEIYNDYPIKELIIHARDRKGMYKSLPDHTSFVNALENTRIPVSYNGNIFHPDDVITLKSISPQTESFMIGRGAVANPALFRQLKGGAPLSQEELRSFHNRILDESLDSGLSPNFAVMRMKELWYYMIHMYPGSEKAFKSLNKSTRLDDFRSAAESIMQGNYFNSNSQFQPK